MTAVTIVKDVPYWGRWGVQEHALFDYEEIRPMPKNFKPTGSPAKIRTDCSGFFTLCRKAAGYTDANRLNYDGSGFTGTLVSAGTEVALKDITPAMVSAGVCVIYGAGDGVHAAVYLDINGGNPLTASHGRPGAPELVTVSDTRESIGVTGSMVRYFHYPLTKLTPAKKIVAVVKRTAAPRPDFTKTNPAAMAVK